MPVVEVEPPTTLGNFAVAHCHELVPGRVWHGSGDGFVARIESVGRVAAIEARPRLETRVRELRRMLSREDGRGVLLPLACGVSISDADADATRNANAADNSAGRRRFLWMVAEAPASGSGPWQPSYLALDSLADTLRFLHDRRFLHGGVTLDNLWLRDDGRTLLAPWAELARAPQVAQASRIFTHAVEATDDVDGFVALVPRDHHYQELLDRATGRRELRPANGLALLHLLRATPRGRAHAASFNAQERQEQLRQLAQEWLAAPPFLETLPFLELRAALDAHLSVELTGELGGGKTRWLTAIAEHEQTRGTIVAGGRGVTRDGVIIEALEDLLGQGHPVEPELEAARGALEPHELTEALVRATKRLATGDGNTRRRLVWLFDDVDTAERRTAKAIQAFRHWAVSQGPAFDLAGRLLVVTTATGTEPTGATRASDAEPGFHRIAIDRLEPLAVKQLVASLTGVHPEADAFAAAIAEETRGNVYHVIELLRVLVDEGALVPLGTKCAIGWDRLHLDRPDEVRPKPKATADTFVMPSGVMDVFGRRFAKLDDLERDVLHALALDGHDVALDLLAEVIGEPIDDIEDVAQELQVAGLVELQEPTATDRTEAEATARVRDARVRKYFVQSLAEKDRRTQHERFVAAYEKRWTPLEAPGPLERWPNEVEATDRRERETRIAILAEHALAAESVGAIAKYVPLAAASCRRRSDLRGARELYDKALAFSGGSDKQRLRCRIALSDILRIVGELDAAESSYPAILEECERLGDRWAQVHGLFGIGGVHLARAQFEQLFNRIRQAHDLASELKDPELLAISEDYLAESENRRGNKVHAQSWAQLAFTSYLGIGDRERACRMQHFLGVILIDDGRYDQARAQFVATREAVSVAPTSDRRQIIRTHLSEAQLAFECGRYPDTFASCAQAVTEATAIGDHHLQCLGRLGMALASMSRSDDQAASRELSHARSLLRHSCSSPYLEAALSWHESWRYLLRGDYGAASRFAERTQDATGELGDRFYPALGTATLGCAALLSGDVLASRRHLSQAMAEIEASGNRYWRNMIATHRAACEIHACQQSLRSDIHLARLLLAEAEAFGVASGAIAVRVKASEGIYSLRELKVRAGNTHA